MGSFGGLLIGIFIDYLCPCILAPLVSASWLFVSQSIGVRVAGFPCVPFRAFTAVCIVDCIVVHKKQQVDPHIA